MRMGFTKQPACRPIRCVLQGLCKAHYHVAYRLTNAVGSRIVTFAELAEAFKVDVDAIFKTSDVVMKEHVSIKFQSNRNKKKI